MSASASQVEAVFLAAIKRPTPAERLAYAEGACAGDPELAQSVRELLLAHDGSVGPLDAPPLRSTPVTRDRSDTEVSGTEIGPYKLRERLGEGGMGVVWVAEQREPVRRKVALKLIKPGMDTDAVIARFEAERQALALMDHPNIARIFDGGTTNAARPFFVMELIRGLKITDYCDRNNLSIQQRLQLFADVCRAVQHAHQKGVIHRDIKPSNVLITLHDGKPVPKIIDFGIAKALNQQLTEKTLYTRVHQAVGTLAYMSPEQAELSGLDIDTRADIYGLGVLLYELLTGTPPFDPRRLEAAAFHEACRIICEEDPPKASTRISSLGASATAISSHRQTDPLRLRQLVRGDLDWILLKSLEKDRTRRYQSANDLAADLDHYVCDEPVTARPPSAWYRFRKYARRNRGLVISGTLVSTMLILGIAGLGTGYVIARRERDKAQDSEIQLEKKVGELRQTQTRLSQSLVDTTSARRRAEETLVKLQDALLERGFLLALNGDLEGVQRVVTDARVAGLGEEWRLVLEGTAHLFRSEVDQAMDLLERAAEDESNVSALALLAVAYIQALEYTKYETLYPRIQRAEPRAAYRDFDEFLLAYVRGDHSFDTTVDKLELLIKKRPSWILLKALICDSRVVAAQQTGDRQQLETALQLTTSLQPLFPGNQFVERTRFAILVAALEDDHRQHRQANADRVREGYAIAESLADYDLADRLRPHFFDLVGETEKARAAWLKAARSGSPLIVQDAIGFLYRNGFDRDAWEVAETCHPETAEVRIARAFMLADKPEEHDEAIRLALTAAEDCPTWWIRQSASKVLLLMGENEQAREYGLQRLQLDPQTEFGCPWIWLDQMSIKYLAGKLDSEPYERQDETMWGKFYYHYTLGCEAIGRADWDQARVHLLECVSRASFVSPEASWARVFLSRLQNDPEWPRGHRSHMNRNATTPAATGND